MLRRHYPASTLIRPCPTPAMAAACRDVEAATLPMTGLPRLPEPPFRRAVPTTPADQAGAHVDCFPTHAAFPIWQEGRHPHCHFRGLLRLHSRYGPPDRSAAQRRPLSRGSNPHEPLISYRINRQLSGWILPPLVIRAFGAHCQNPTSAALVVTTYRDCLDRSVVCDSLKSGGPQRRMRSPLEATSLWTGRADY